MRWIIFLSFLMALGPAIAAQAATCIYDTQGKVVHRPPGAECRDVAEPSKIRLSDYRTPKLEPKGPWLSFVAGDDRIYTSVFKRGTSRFGEPFEYDTFRGTQRREVVQASAQRGSNQLEERITTQVTESVGAMDRVALQRRFLRQLAPTSFELVASNQYWLGRRRDIAYAAGSRLLPPQIAKGATWPSGNMNIDDMSIEETGTILGYQDVKLQSGTFEKCLVVRYDGTIKSHRKRLDGRPKVGGNITRTTWYGRGIGIVMEKEHGEMATFIRGERWAFTMQSELAIKGIKPTVLPASASKR
jgi:hypothetical protein